MALYKQKKQIFKAICIQSIISNARYIQLLHQCRSGILKMSSSISSGPLKVFIESLTALMWRVSPVGFGEIQDQDGPARAGWACLGPDAGASVQAWHWDICGAQAHQLLSPCHRQLDVNIHKKCRLMCVFVWPRLDSVLSVELSEEVMGQDRRLSLGAELIQTDGRMSSLFHTSAKMNFMCSGSLLCMYFCCFVSGCGNRGEQLPVLSPAATLS